MAQQKISRDAFEAAAYDADIDVEHDILWDYHGRFMQGTCPAIRATGPGALARFFMELTKSAIDDPRDGFDENMVADMADNTMTDSLAGNALYYWPSFTATEEV